MSYADDIQKQYHLSFNGIVGISRSYVPDRFKSRAHGTTQTAKGVDLITELQYWKQKSNVVPICLRMGLCIIISLCVHWMKKSFHILI